MKNDVLNSPDNKDNKMPDLSDYLAYAVFGGLVTLFLYPVLSKIYPLEQNQYFIIGALLGVVCLLHKKSR